MAGTVGLMAASCADSLDLKPIDYFGSGNFWESQELFEGHLSGTAAKFRSTLMGVGAADDFNNPSLLYTRAGELRSGIYSLDLIDGAGAKQINFINNNITEGNPGFTNFANIYSLIGDLNEFLYYVEANASVFKSEEARQYMKGMALGLRAYCYFQLNKMWGSVPLRTTPDVVLGNINPVELQKPRAKVSEVLAQIKTDVKESIECFKAGEGYTKFSRTKVFWNIQASKMLAGEVYLWSGKVSRLGKGDVVDGAYDYKANPADVAVAKGYFEDVVKNYGYSLQPTYADVFSYDNKANSEIIFTVGYELDVAAPTNWISYIWSPTGTTTKNGDYLMPVDEVGFLPSTTAQWSGYYYNPETGVASPNEIANCNPSSVNRAMYRNAVFFQYDANDSRRACFMPAYQPNDADMAYKEGLKSIPNFDAENHYLAGAFFNKFRFVIATNGKYTNTNDQPIYRLPLAYMYLAEIANYEDATSADVAKYINMVRERAYGSDWDETQYGYKNNGNFRENEVAILQEKTKEFIGEGQRWWDLCRLTAVKNGATSDHLVFQPESCAGWGLDLANHPYWTATAMRDESGNITTTPVLTNTPVLDYATQWHLLLYPINAGLISTDQLEQTPGYGVNQ